MAHYAFLDENNIVTEVITGIDETELIEGLDTETWYGNFRGQVCKRTSYNGNIRKNYAGLGYSYNETLDAFVPPKPFDSWTLNEETCLWQAPVAYPTDGFTHNWNEESLTWDLIENSIPPESWVLNENTIRWEPPVAYPDDGKKYAWDEETISWKLIEEIV
jgi:hypothetical protein